MQDNNNNNIEGPQIDVSSPGEPKVLTFYQAVETASINNEQTDVRQLWELGKANEVEKTTTTDSHGTNSDPQPTIIPITKSVTTINDISSSNDNTVTPTPDFTEISSNSNSVEATSETEESPKQTTIMADSSSTESKKFETTEFTSESSMSTSTELITEVSVSMSDIVNQNSLLLTSTSPLTPTNDVITVNAKTSEESTTTLKDSERSLTEMPLSSSLDSVMSTVETPAAAEVENSREPKKLDDTVSEQPEVSNSIFDITLPASNNETTKPTIVEIQVEQEPMRTTRLEILAQVKTTTNPGDKSNNNFETTENQTEMLASFDIVTDKPLTIDSTNFGYYDLPRSSDASVTDPSLYNTKTIAINNPSESARPIDIFPNTNLPSFTTTMMEKNYEEIDSTRQPEIVQMINDGFSTNANKPLNTMDVEIQFHNAVNNATVPAGTEKLTPSNGFLLKKETQLAFQKFLESVLNSREKNTSFNDSLNNNLTADLMQIVKKLSDYSSSNKFRTSLDEKKLDSSSDGLPQLLGGFLDNTNKILPVTNDDSTVENNYVTSRVVVQETNLPITTTVTSEQTIANAITNTESYTQNSVITTQVNNAALETTTLPSVTTPLTVNNPSSSLTTLTNVDAPYFTTRMKQMILKLLDEKAPTEKPTDFQTQNLAAQSLDTTEPLPVDNDLTEKTTLDSTTSLESTTIAIDSETSDLSTISPTMFTRFQDSSPATAQKTAGTNKRPSKRPITKSNPRKSYPSSSVSSSNIANANNSSTPNPKSPSSSVPAETTPKLDNNMVKSTKMGSPVSTTNNARIASKNRQQQKTTTSNPERFGTSRLIPTPMMNSSTTTTAPLRDYLIYGILPNKTIIRKRPEDNLIDPRNVDSPYVIFGIFPDGKLVRKFPNGTIIPDPPTNPVEIVFSPTVTTTTNKPRLTDNQINNRGMSNKNVNFLNKYNVNTQKAFFAPNEVDNALSGLTSFELPIGSVPSDIKMVYHAHLYVNLSKKKYI